MRGEMKPSVGLPICECTYPMARELKLSESTRTLALHTQKVSQLGGEEGEGQWHNMTNKRGLIPGFDIAALARRSISSYDIPETC